MVNSLLSVSSVSGGKTSSYMALHYPTDKYVFAVVKTIDLNAIPKDKGLLRECRERIPDFIASRELDQTLKVVLDLEQEIGQKIDWVSALLTYDELISKKKTLPNFFQRFCTTDLKIQPVFEYCYNLGSLGNMVLMNIGFRADESKRKDKLLSKCETAYRWKFPYLCNLQTRKQKWKTVEWRIPYFPLIENKVNHQEIKRFWLSKGWSFPDVSNCDYCFFHQYHEHQTQLEQHPERFDWWIQQEEKTGKTFNKKYSFREIKDPDYSIQQTPLFSNCHCTD